MKKSRKITFKIFIGVVIVLSLTFLYLLSDFNIMFQDKKYLLVTQELSRNEKQRSLNLIANLYNKIHKSNEKYCACELVTHNVKKYNVFRPSFSKTIYALKLDKKYGDNNCLKFLVQNQEFENSIVGIEKASIYYFTKSLDELTEIERIMLLVIYENPRLYNPKKRERQVQEKAMKYLDYLNKQNGN